MTRHWNWFNADALGVLRGKYSSPVFAVKIGEAAIRKSLREQLGVLKDDAKRLGEFPTVIGEIGTPMELDEKYSYGGRDGRGKGKGDYREQVKALDASLYALDGANTLSVTIWTYCTDSSHKWGDGWNGEDLSLWSVDDERTSGSITGLRKDIRRSRASRLMSPLREEKDRAHATVQEVTDEDSSSQRGATPSDIPSLSNPNFVSRSTAVNTEELVGYQVSSATLTLDDLVYVKRSAQSLSTSLTLTNATSSRATLLPAYTAAIKPSQSISTITNTQSFPSLSFPAFSSAPMAFAFLTNGARAWKAFVRAYPLAIVGLPKGWEWDCNKAVFEMTVRVGSGDRSSSSPASSADGTNVSGFSEQGVATEIFLPLLHFAKDEVVKKAFGVPVHSRTTTGQQNLKVTARGGETMYPARKNALSSGETGGAAAIPLLDDPSTVSLALDRPTAGSKFPPLEMARTRSIAPSTPLNRSRAGLHDADGDADGDAETASLSSSYAGEGDEDGMDHALGLEVEVSAGRWSVEGQVLKWWYPIPIETSATKTSTSTGDSTLVSPPGTANPNDHLARKKSAASMSSSQKGKRTAGTTSSTTTTTTTKPLPRLDEEGKVEYKIRIRRRGGPIDFKKLGIPENWVGLGPRSNSERKTQSTEGSGRTGCCGDGCIIM
ncbi:hypothetical protein FRC14_001097 [Serendipita sp. 396]|nr:hypothetical protein FRC14_001097 [Serendipita sp. 396]